MQNKIETTKTRTIANLHSEQDVREGLTALGYTSSTQIFHKPRWEFVKEVSDENGILTPDEAEEVYEKARHNYILLSHLMTALNTGYRQETYRGLKQVGIIGEESNFFENIPNYQEIFGSQDYCECEDCKSIFGPAAYFVDLMRIAQKHIYVGTTPILEETGVPLKTRRPDLFNLKLSCENTNKTMPHVEITTNILKPHAKAYFGIKSEADDIELLSALSQELFPVQLPYCHPTEKLAAWLSSCKINFGDILQIWDYDTADIARASLGMSHSFFDMLQKPLEDNILKKCIGKTPEFDLENLAELSKLPVFLKTFALEREELTEILTQDITDSEALSRLPQLFINTGLQKGLFLKIVSKKKQDTISYTIANLNKSSLERFYRFLRVKRAFNLPSGELDWLIKITGNGDKNINLPQIRQITSLAKNISTDIYTVCALLHDIKNYGANPFLKITGRTPDEMAKFSASEIERIVSSALGIHPDDINRLKDHIGECTTGYADLIFRHHKMSKMLGLGMEEYIALLKSAFPAVPKFFTAENINKLFTVKLQRDQGIITGFFEIDAIVNTDPLSSPYVEMDFSLEGFYEKGSFIRQNAPDTSGLSEELITSYVYSELSQFFGESYENVIRLFVCAFAGTDLTLEKWAQAVLDENTEPESLASMVKIFSKYLLIFKFGIPLSLIEATLAHPGTLSAPLSFQGIIDLCMFTHLFSVFQDTGKKLLSFIPAYAKDKSDIGILHEVTGQSETRINNLYPLEKRSGNIVAFITSLRLRFAIQNKLALDDAAVGKLLSLCSSGMEFADKLKITDELSAPSASPELHAAIMAKLRDAIVPIAILQLGKAFADITNADKLYKYLLTDVQMDDKTAISPIKEGINALQLYLQRCRMRLEKGSRTDKFPESWWQWVMDYRMWEANRKIFVYPENYLLPSIRQSKTSLFKDVEHALEQSKITAGYIEEQYIKYLDRYYELTSLKICGAYETTVDGFNVLYLFARTREEPCTYYYCKKVSSLAWSEWEKIDTTIDSVNITPVFVFNRLHIFWSRITESPKVQVEGGGTLSADNQKSYSLHIKYTYLNLQGKWITPQTLAGSEIVYAEDDKKNNKLASSKEALGLERPKDNFSRLTLMRLTKTNVEGFMTVPEDYERLVVITGGFTHNVGKIIDKTSISGTINSDMEMFSKKLAKMTDANNFLVNGNETGFFSTGFFKVFNEDLAEDKFIHDNEFILTDGYIPIKHTLIYSVLHDAVSNAIGGFFSQSIITDAASPTKGILPHKNNGISDMPKLTEQSFINDVISEDVSDYIYGELVTAGIIDSETHTVSESALVNFDLLSLLGDIFVNNSDDNSKTDTSNYILEIQRTLLANIGSVHMFTKVKNAEVIPVVNRPGKFIYDCGDEAFLVYPVYQDEEGNYETLEFEKIDAGVTVGTVITPWSFMHLGFDFTVSDAIFETLKTCKIINENNIVNRVLCTIEALRAAKDPVGANCEKIYVRLMNLPFIPKEAFDGIEGIDPKGENPIIETLKNNGVLYNCHEENMYRIDLRRMNEGAGMVFVNSKGGALTPKAVSTVYERLVTAVSPVGLNYRPTELPPDFPEDHSLRNRQFAVQRLTNPTIKKLKRKLEAGGISGFLKRETQSPPEAGKEIMPFSRLGPSANIVQPNAKDGAQIDFDGLYAEYNWELFFHIPITIASSFWINAMYEESKEWFHYVFNPTKAPGSEEEKTYWNFYPFVNAGPDSLLKYLTDNTGAIRAYNDSPFDPHAIARLRINAYAKYTIMEYVKNIIQWGDSQFTLNTWESLTTATMMYVWAKDLLGPKPVNLGKPEEHAPISFSDVEAKYKENIPQFIIDLETTLQEHIAGKKLMPLSDKIPFNDIRAYFGVPENKQFLQMWDVVDDRLFKLRNSLDINGTPRITALFEPEIDPLAVAKAAAAAAAGGPKPLGRQGSMFPYRFSYMSDLAKSVTSALIQLSNSMITALEKKDAEALMSIVNTQEMKIITMTTDIKENYIEELSSGIKSLILSKASAEKRYNHYKKYADEYMSTKEITSFSAATVAAALAAVGGGAMFAAGVAHLAPQVGSPFAMKYGGMEIGESLRGVASGYETLAGISNHISSQTAIMAQYDRRRDDWNLQKQMAEDEMGNIDEQLIAARSRLESAKKDLDIHKNTIIHKAEVLEFYKQKFSGARLYQFLEGRLAGTMWQSYQLALELAVAAQESYRFERDEDDDFVRFDYWDGTQRGLAAGEGLMMALDQMTTSYHKKNTRRLEIEKNISLKTLFPEDFAKFISSENETTSGIFCFNLSEKLFAKDYPGGYRRKITSVSVTIPAVLPPYETVKATLKQLESHVLLEPDKSGVDYLFGTKSSGAPDTVKKIIRPGAKIALSRGIDDTGAFVLDFNDVRYLPFEGTGVAASWVLEMPHQSNAFNFASISDIIMTVRYTALEDEVRGGQTFHEYVSKKIKEEGL